jgi:RNA polymerase sigma factor (TIGR02999 family)
MDQSDITRLLGAWTEGDRGALDQLTPLIYEELRRLADRSMRGEAAGHTLQATALVHEAYERLVSTELPWRNRAHFLGTAAQIMRRVLVDHARVRNSIKRGVDFSRVSFDQALEIAPEADEVVLELDAALEKLGRFDALKSRILEMRFFGGLTYQETADALDISTSELDRELRLAKAWLRHQLEVHDRA